MSVIIVTQSLDVSLLLESGVPFLMGCLFGTFGVTVVFPITMIWGLVSFLETKDHTSKIYW